MPYMITVSSRGRIPYLGKIGPIGTPFEVTDALYEKLMASGVQVTVVDKRESDLKNMLDYWASEVKAVTDAEKVEEPKVIPASMKKTHYPYKSRPEQPSETKVDLSNKIVAEEPIPDSMKASFALRIENEEGTPEVTPTNQKNAQNMSRKQRKKLNAEMRRQNASAKVEEKGAQTQNSSSSTDVPSTEESKESANGATPDKKETQQDA